MLHAGHVDAADEQVGHLVTINALAELPIDRDRYNTVDPARYDDPLLTGPAAQNREGFTTEMGEECRIDDDDVILVTLGILLLLLCRRVLPMRRESRTGAGFRVKISAK